MGNQSMRMALLLRNQLSRVAEHPFRIVHDTFLNLKLVYE